MNRYVLSMSLIVLGGLGVGFGISTGPLVYQSWIDYRHDEQQRAESAAAAGTSPALPRARPSAGLHEAEWAHQLDYGAGGSIWCCPFLINPIDLPAQERPQQVQGDQKKGSAEALP